MTVLPWGVKTSVVCYGLTFLLLLSTSPEGLQNAINKTHCFYNDLGLQMNTNKTKVLIFSIRGIKITKNNLFVGNSPLEIIDQ